MGQLHKDMLRIVQNCWPKFKLGTDMIDAKLYWLFPMES